MFFREFLDIAKIEEQIEIVRDTDVNGWGTLHSYPEWNIFTYVDDIKFAKLSSPFFKFILTTKDVYEEIKDENIGIGLCGNPKMAFWRLHNALGVIASQYTPQTHSRIAVSSQVSKLAVIDPYDVEIGENCLIEPFVTIHAGTRIGKNTIIRSGSKIGGIGFEYKKWDGILERIPHYGGVLIGDNVDIHYNCCISRGVFLKQDTVIGNNVKIDNLTHISHGVKVGQGTMMAAGTVIAGNTIVNDGVWIGLGSVIKQCLLIGDNAFIGMGSVVGHNVGENEFVLGNPARRLK